MHKCIFTLLLYILYVLPIQGQVDSSAEIQYDDSSLTIKKIEANDLDAYRNDPDFDYEVLKTDATWWSDFKTWSGNLMLQFFEWLFGVEKAVGFLASFFRWIPYILLGILIFILIKFFLNINATAMQRTKNNQGLVSLSEEEHIIKNEDIQQLIQKALQNQNYRLAIRYYYLYILQLMSEEEFISWEPQKTNDDYLKEIEVQELKLPFGKITRLYTYIWYGNFDIDEAGYKRAETVFSSLQKLVRHG
ncbi:DUF4129 domain-containing protein [Kriegella aquimaris]|uniref:Protein-glutamine gamma-glutamyltransferase-like C-terminal domain-containing protein n=1 Tax=Kriegella aquimaris TaxID=192904 RepID=A0A1G9WB70_9FLAO|nr:DUF4129 domain-containing protein [Kriegella aquimaris]SDM81788.1 protein of unknown function [Kriegella aquimaris]